LWELSGGTMATTVGGDFRHDAMHDIAPAIDAFLGSIPGRQPYDVHAARNVASLFGELDLPITKQLDLDAAVRADDYSDFGGTVNPKLSLRYQPTKILTLRGAFSTGFRAPSLIDSYGYNVPAPTKTTSGKWDDPTLCDAGPNYVVGKPGTGQAVPGAITSSVCNAKQSVMTGSNPALTPEKSKSFTAGFVVDPMKDLSVTVDYWRIHVSNTIGALSENTIFGNPTLFASNFVYNYNAAGVPTSLAYVNEVNQNLGDSVTSGEDLDVLYRLPKSILGNFTAHLTGTYTNMYEFQTSKGSAWCQNVGQFGCGGLSLGSYSSGTNVMTFRWQHNLMLQWNNGPWAATVAEKYQSGYHDGTAVATSYYRDISSYSITNFTGSYSGIKNLTLSAGIQNLFAVKPPITNTQSTGLLTPIDSIVGRAYMLSATYKFL
jgi:iron complex outermembrane receptor protein